MIRVVLDTNIFISGIFWSGDSEKILYAWGDEEFELVTSNEIIEEIIIKKTMCHHTLKCVV